MDITLRKYISNPMGGNTMTHTELYSKMFNEKLDKMIDGRKSQMFSVRLYRASHDVYYSHIKVPSESLDGVEYDVVFKFYPISETADKAKSAKTLHHHGVKMFSNDDAFNYTYVYTFNKQKLLVEELINKCSRVALTTEPVKTNPNGIVGYVKTIYLAYLIMERYGLFNKAMYNSNSGISIEYTKSKLQNSVLSYDEMRQLIDLKKKSVTNKKDPNIKKAISRIETGVSNNTKSVRYIKPIQAVKNLANTVVGTVSKENKYTKKAGKIRKIGK